MPVLVDSSFLYELYDRSAPNHASAQTVAARLHGVLWVPDVVLTEVAFLARRMGGVPAVAGFIQALEQSSIQRVVLADEDLHTARAIMLNG